jgi:hypothetical protein
MAALMLGSLACGDVGDPADPPRDESAAAGPQRETTSRPEVKPGGRPRREETGPGRWRRFRSNRLDPELPEEQRAMIARLESIGYVSGSVEAKDVTGVTRYDPDRAHLGLNLYTSGHAPEAFLIDMEGRVLHRWRRAVHQVWPSYPREWIPATAEFWRRAHVFENGDLLAIFENLGLVKLNRNSEVVWARPGREHHDLEVTANGDIYVLSSESHLVTRVDPVRPLREDFIAILDPDGREKRRISLLEAFEGSRFAHIWDESEQKWGDSFHTNTLEVLDGRLAERIPEFRRGNVLISVLKLDTIAVVDLEQGRVVWAQRGDFKRQHDPTVLPNGNLLLFDNRGGGTHSRVIELDPLSAASAWEYAGSAAEPFFSAQCGTAQRLANGNTLITESDNGRAFEVTAAGEIVWEFFNPHRAGEDEQYIATLFEVLRLPPDFPTDWSRAASSR